MTKILDGKKLSAELKIQIKDKTKAFINSGGKQPHLAVILVGNNPASESYVKSKVKSCEEVGFKSSLIKKEEQISQEDLLDLIHTINEDSDIDGLLVQLPLPSHISEEAVTLAIHPSKDVDGFHPENTGRMCIGMPAYLPATPSGIMELLKAYNIETAGKHCVVLGRSNIVGTPISVMLSRNSYPGNCTVSICHSKTKNLKDFCLSADILIAAIGKPQFVTADMVKEGAVIIDVGINRIETTDTQSGYRLVGDVDYNSVLDKASYITPVPGGVGPMTIASLLQNTLLAAEKKIYA
jgi:methylenetetrahydrofolate dehydrogenase (NADP+)/methenyltetrahydrofolate cyclohydrolase